MLLRLDLGAILELAAKDFLECVEIERRLGLQAAVEELRDREDVVDGLIDLGLAASFGKRIHDQSVELRVLRFVDPVMLEQTLEERVDVAVVLDAAEVVLLRHPFDHQDDEADRERIVAEDLVTDCLGWSDHWNFDREASDESCVEALEQMDVLRFLAGEVEQRANTPVILEQVRTGMVEQEGKDELLHHAEHAQIFVRGDLVQSPLLESVEAWKRTRSRQAFRHEVAGEVQ